MTKKVKCNVTGDWSYVSEERYNALVAKYGSEEKLIAEYVTRAGKKLVEELGSPMAAAAAAQERGFKNKIACTVTGELCYISDVRLASLVTKQGSEQAVRENYVSRVAARLLKAGKTAEEIKKMAEEGTLPPPAKKGEKAEVEEEAPVETPAAPVEAPVEDEVPPVVEEVAKAAKPAAKKKSAKKKASK